jgi:hypothetical protein
LALKKILCVCSPEWGLWTHVLGHVAPPATTVAMGMGSQARHGAAGENMHGSGGLARPLPIWPPVPQASLAFPLVMEQQCFCAPSYSHLLHWEPSSWRLLGRGCQPEQDLRVAPSSAAPWAQGSVLSAGLWGRTSHPPDQNFW